MKNFDVSLSLFKKGRTSNMWLHDILADFRKKFFFRKSFRENLYLLTRKFSQKCSVVRQEKLCDSAWNWLLLQNLDYFREKRGKVRWFSRKFNFLTISQKWKFFLTKTKFLQYKQNFEKLVFSRKRKKPFLFNPNMITTCVKCSSISK